MLTSKPIKNHRSPKGDERAVRAAFSVGDWVFGVGEHRGCSQVFEGYGKYQPFDYLNDFDPDNFRLATKREIEESDWTGIDFGFAAVL